MKAFILRNYLPVEKATTEQLVSIAMQARPMNYPAYVEAVKELSQRGALSQLTTERELYRRTSH